MVSSLSAGTSPLRVVSLNPIISDLATQVGGTKVEIITLLPPGASPHAYRPTPEDFKAMGEADLILASGKGLENCLPDIRDSVPQVEVIEVSRVLPGLILNSASGEFDACPHHDHGKSDPHWWHSLKETQRVVRFLGTVFGTALPVFKDEFFANALVYRKHLEQLDHWAQDTFALIPEQHRILATAHSAFNYLCRDYGFKAIPVRGLNNAQSASPQHLRRVIDELKKKNVRTFFPEWNDNASVLTALLHETNLAAGPALLADTTNPDLPGYENMFRYNVETITRALTGETAEQ